MLFGKISSPIDQDEIKLIQNIIILKAHVLPFSAFSILLKFYQI